MDQKNTNPPNPYWDLEKQNVDQQRAAQFQKGFSQNPAWMQNIYQFLLDRFSKQKEEDGNNT